jgi:hypothetical protein
MAYEPARLPDGTAFYLHPTSESKEKTIAIRIDTIQHVKEADGFLWFTIEMPKQDV